ncbi:MAG TPA: hypothetical protein ACFYD1_03475 [Candidatus Hypogeohydataceae bacterium YC38]|nr:hypothetical protein [Candidatus Brocadiales bacterium]
MPLDLRTIKDMIRRDISLKTITDIVAYRISQTPDHRGAAENFIIAEGAVGAYIAENFRDMKDLQDRLSQISQDTRGLQELAEVIDRDFSRKRQLTFQRVKESITKAENIALKAVTDIVAYKIYQSPENKGPEINFITAETFVAHYISEHFASMDDFRRKLEELGGGAGALRQFADTIYRCFCEQKQSI